MKISTKGRYALRMLLDLSHNQKDGYIALKEIAGRQGISQKYLEQIVMLLGKNSVLRSSRGYQGGYRLAKKPEEITVGEVLRLTEGSLAPVACLQREENDCERCSECEMLRVWQGLERVIYDYLDNITLADIPKGHLDICKK
ncbi:MAG: Rrf2 family transcriptional regulator [Eubacteriales bacterium]|nr:Rrf2 family transcriptional regulator [Eubacteriales bacterium]